MGMRGRGVCGGGVRGGPLVGNKKQSSSLGARAASHSYQLHGGVILVPAPQHHAHLTSRQGGKEKRKKKKKRGGGGRSTCPRARQVGPPGPESFSPPPAPPGIPGTRGRRRALGPSPGARRPRCPALGPPSLAPRRPPRLRQIKQLPLRPSARASQRGGRWGRGGGGSGPAGSPPPRRPAGCLARPPALLPARPPPRERRNRGRGLGGGEGAEVVAEERFFSFSRRVWVGGAARQQLGRSEGARGRGGGNRGGYPSAVGGYRVLAGPEPRHGPRPSPRALNSVYILFLHRTHSSCPTVVTLGPPHPQKQLEVDISLLPSPLHFTTAPPPPALPTMHARTHTHASQEQLEVNMPSLPSPPRHPPPHHTHTLTHTLPTPAHTLLRQQHLFPAT